MSLSNAIRSCVVVGAMILCAASAGSQRRTSSGEGATQKNVVFYETRPKFDWPYQRGETVRVVLWRVPKQGSVDQQRVALYDQQNYTEHTWQPPDDLDFETRYELYVYNPRQEIITSVGFAIGYEPPKVQGALARAGAKVNSLSPEIRVSPFSYANVWLAFDISESSSFDKVIDSAFIPQEGNVLQFPGPDGEMNTADDVRYVRWDVGRVLKPNKTYHWRVRAYYFMKSEMKPGVKPDPQNAIGHSELVGEFTIPPQSGSDSLANITQITRDNLDTTWPTVSRKNALAYVARLPEVGSEIRVAGVTIQNGVPVYDTGREEFTKSVKGSWDMRPQWDVDGEGIFFDSDRSQQISNIWYKRRDTRGYTQLTFHNVNAWGPTISKDGNKVAYQVLNQENLAGWSIWVVDRDGRSATELGAGEEPAFSPDGKRISFSARDASGNKQIWVMDTNGGNRVQITNEFNNFNPVWHPSGKRLVFVSNRTDNNDIWMIDLDGARMVQLTNYLGDDNFPEFTPDGRFLLFASQRGGDVHHIWMGEISQ